MSKESIYHDIRDYGASQQAERNTQSIQAAIEAAAQAGGGRVLIPPGRWRSGTIWLRSGVELHLTQGATLLGTNNPEDYPYWSAVEEGLVISRRPGPRRMIGAVNCVDVAVTGPGSIDGEGGCAGKINEPGGAEKHAQNLQFIACRGVQVQQVKLCNAGSWMQQYLACEEVHIHGIRVWNHGNKTNDGLDIDGCRDVRISDCDIDSHDDALVFKSTGPRHCQNIVVSNCRLRSNCHGIKFGTESVGGFENIRIANCMVGPSRVPEPMDGFPQGRPVISGCALECVDGGQMRAISITGLIVDGVFAPIFIKLGNRHERRIPEEDFQGQGLIEDIHISDVLARNCGPISASITGYPGNPVRRISLSDINIEQRGGVQAGEILDPVPENSGGYPEVNMFAKGDKASAGKQLPSWGLYLRHVEDISLRNVHMRLSKADARVPIVCDTVSKLSLQGLRCNDLLDHDCLHIRNPASP